MMNDSSMTTHAPHGLHYPLRITHYYALITLWVATMIAIPILRWNWGDEVLPWSATVSVLLLLAAVVVLLGSSWGVWQAGRVLAIILPLAWAIEWVGSTTGFPFGEYDYTARLQPQVAGVPLLIPLAWMMMLPAAWSMASVLTGANRGGRFVLVSALVFTAWDFFLDPQMVGWGFWVWSEQNMGANHYFGIPWVNFAGWALSAALLTAVARPLALPIGPFFLIYVITWILQTIGQLLFWQMPGPALVGFAAMGLFVVSTLWKANPAALRMRLYASPRWASICLRRLSGRISVHTARM